MIWPYPSIQQWPDCSKNTGSLRRKPEVPYIFHKVDVKSLIAINEQYMADAIGRKLHFFEKRRLFVPDNDPHGIRQVFPCTLVDHLLDVDLVLQTAADE